MAGFIKGDIVVVPFPFSDLSSTKRRPAYVACNQEDNDVILCQITSQAVRDKKSIKITNSNFLTGSLPQPKSNIRPNKIFTAEQSLITKTVGHLDEASIVKVTNKIVEIFEDK
jgi:mRNA interferase MazF